MRAFRIDRRACETLLLCALLTAALALGGCGGAKTAPAPPTAAPTAAPTEAPTPAPTPEPTPEPTPAPTPEPTPEPTEAPTPEPTPEPTPAGPAATPVAPGLYTYESPEGTWTLSLREDGLFTITDPDGEPHTGEGWDTGYDGVVNCGPTDIYSAPFAFNGGCSRWTVQGETCRPAERAG